jgi:hypothetical protein
MIQSAIRSFSQESHESLAVAVARVHALTLRVLADRLDHGESLPSRLMSISFAVA